MVEHQLLGDTNHIPDLLYAAIVAWNNIGITNTNTECNILLRGSTLPHAGFQYSGMVALMTLLQLIENKSSEDLTFTILWFQHNPKSTIEHSLCHVKQLIIYLTKILKVDAKINDVLINADTEYSNVEHLLEGIVIASTDFSHHNYGAVANNIIEVWNNDKHQFSKEHVTTNVQPCGREPLRIYKQWISSKNYKSLLGSYSNSNNKEHWWINNINDKFSGVTYASLLSYSGTNNYSILQSKLLALPHLEWCNCYLNYGPLPALFWSPLINLKGSCFVSVSKKNNEPYSCFGTWESDNNNLLECFEGATNVVMQSSWHGNKVNRDTLDNLKKNDGGYVISISLISPISNWINVSGISNDQQIINKGYVYYDKNNKHVGMTFLPSVWSMFGSTEHNKFFEHLKNKHENVYGTLTESDNWTLYSYDVTEWKYKFA